MKPDTSDTPLVKKNKPICQITVESRIRFYIFFKFIIITNKNALTIHLNIDYNLNTNVNLLLINWF